MNTRLGLFKVVGMLLTTGLIALACPLAPSESVAQRPPQDAGTKKKQAGDAPDPKKEKPEKKAAQPADGGKKNEPQAPYLESDDGVLIAATYFPSTQGKTAPAIILLHGLGGTETQKIFFPSGDEKDSLAFELQDRGYAVLSFDFRGHGHSKEPVKNPRRPEQKGAASRGKLDANDLRTPAQILTMLNDIEAAKRFLVRRNNAGELNIAKLGVVGSEMGASLGILWSYRDWFQFPPVGGTKQGQDVLAMSLISPSYNLKGVTVTKELAELERLVPIQVLVGKKKKEDKAYKDASKIADLAKKARRTDGDSQLNEFPTELQGGKLLNPDQSTPEIAVEARKAIVKFFDSTLRNKTVRWEMREVTDTDAAGQ